MQLFFFIECMHSLNLYWKKENIDLPTDFSHVINCDVSLLLKNLYKHAFCLAVTCIC